MRGQVIWVVAVRTRLLALIAPCPSRRTGAPGPSSGGVGSSKIFTLPIPFSMLPYLMGDEEMDFCKDILVPESTL